MVLEAIKSIFPYQIILILALITAFLKFKWSPIKWLLPWLVYCCVIEIFISYYFMIKYGSNYFIANLYSFSTIYFFSSIYLVKIKHKSLKRLIAASLFTWSLVMFNKILYMNYQCEIENKIYLSGLIIVMFQILIFLKETLNGESIRFFSNPKLILAFSILIFITCSFPLVAFLDYFLKNNEVAKAYTDILDIGNIILSLGYLGAALCIKKTPPSTTSS